MLPALRGQMTLPTMYDEFSLRFYKWARKEAVIEVGENLGRLRTLPSSLARRTVAVCDALPHAEQEVLFSSLVKTFHPRGSELAGESRTEPEERLFQSSLTARTQRTEAEAKPSEAPRMSRRLLVMASRRHLELVLGQPFDKPEPRIERYKRMVSGWTIWTWVSFGNPPFYFHDIEDSSG